MRLKIACEKAKQDLSSIKETEIELDYLAEDEDFVINIDRPKFNDLCDFLQNVYLVLKEH